MKQFVYFISFYFLTAHTLFAQTESIFSNLSGNELLNALANNYSPTNSLSYSETRDILWAEYAARNNNYLTCIYTGHSVYLNPNEDPTTAAFDQGINTEHTWPQGLGAGNGSAKSDMHHIFPSEVDVNNARGSYPFAEINDWDTDEWYRFTSVYSNTPSQNIDEYSEIDLDAYVFEPREDHKGNVARAMIYFYTIYRSQANSVDANFFPPQLDTFCDWHAQDPADEAEIAMTNFIKTRQGNANPFVLDPSLVNRLYCWPTAVNDLPEQNEDVKFSPCFPNPFSEKTNISYELPYRADVSISIYDMKGKQVAFWPATTKNIGVHNVEWALESNKKEHSTVYFCQIFVDNGKQQQVQTQKIIYLD
ncbi:MAG: endonuclease [Chitinophagales bacterium]